jgi:hypothetical protein
MAEFEARIGDDAATPFELGLQILGELLGFESVRPNERADPDGVWRDEDRQWILFEAKTEVQADKPISAEEIRQATTHRQWVLNQLGWDGPEQTATVIVTRQQAADEDARAVAGEVFVVSPVEVRHIAERVVAVYRELRARALGLSEEQLKGEFAAAFGDRGLDTAALVEQLSQRRATD